MTRAVVLDATSLRKCCCSSFVSFGSAREGLGRRSSRRRRRVGFAGRARRVKLGARARVVNLAHVGRAGTQRRRARVIDASSRRFSKHDGRRLPRTAFSTRRAVQSRACSRDPMSMPSKPSVAFKIAWAAPAHHHRRRAARARACFCRLSTSCRRNSDARVRSFFAASWRRSSVSLLPRQTLALRHSHSAPLSSERRRREHEPRDDRPKTVVVVTPRAPARRRRRSAAAVRGGGPRVARGRARRATRCAASESEADKTVSALDAILAGLQDEPAPEEVRQRVSEPQRALTRSSVSRHTHPRTRAYTTPRLFFVSRVGAAAFAFWKAALLLCAAFAVGAPRSATARV